MSIKYIIYCRKSSDESSWKQAQSIPDQIQKCIEFAKKEKLTIMKKPENFSDFQSEKELHKEEHEKDIESRRIYKETYDLFIVKESKSAKKPWWRKKRMKIIELIEKWEIQWLLSYSPDRQARNMIDGWTVIELADDAKVDLKYTTFHFINNASGRMMLGFWFVFSKQYSDKLSEDIWRWNKTTASKWKSLWKYKYGYYRDDEDGYYKPHKQYFKLMKKAFELKIYEKKSDIFIGERLNSNWYYREYKSSSEKKSVNPKRLWNIRRDPFYYWIFISWENVTDLRQEWVNPYYEAMISENEHQILQDRFKDKTHANSAKERKEKYDEITPYVSWLMTTEDWYKMSSYTPWPKRHQQKLEKLQIENPKATLADVVKSHQIRCRCTTKYSKFQNLEITYNVIEGMLLNLLEKLVITDEAYGQYSNFVHRELEKRRKGNIEEWARIQLQINRIKKQREDYIRDNMSIKKDKEEEQIYEKSKMDYDNQIEFLKTQKDKLDTSERNQITEFEIFIKILQKAPQYFKKANYVQKRKITSLLVSNITVNAEKQVSIKVHPWLEELFSLDFSTFGDDRTRTGVWKGR